MKKLSVNAIVSNVLADLLPRQREVLESRYGLKQKEPLTLAEIGNRYSVTRERIRQIEHLALIAVSGKTTHPDFKSFVALVANHLGTMGGARREDMLYRDVRKMTADTTEAEAIFANKIHFLLEVSGAVSYRAGDRDFYPFWHTTTEALDGAVAFVDRLTTALAAGENWQTVVREPLAENHLALSKKFATNVYGDFGLRQWPHINPKTARDWAYLVLKKGQKPLHFTELAKAINRLRQGKIANVQTVHNELIKDSRFVLVGRGVYGLQEFNLMAGTCREVIGQILKEHGPQTTKNLIRLVIAKRDFKENTLILNLQSKKHFQRLADGRYTVREA